MKKRVLSLLLCLALAFTLAPSVAAWPSSGDGVNYGNSYNHIDVKVDGEYTISVDGTQYKLEGVLLSESIVVKIGNEQYYFRDYDVNEQTEAGQNEYEIRLNGRQRFNPKDISWVSGTYQMTNVSVSARMFFDSNSVNQTLAEVFNSLQEPVTIGGKQYTYYVDIEDMDYTGVQECTGGNGMRSEENSGTPSGLDLYIQAEGLGVYITKGKLAIKKVVVNEGGDTLSGDEATFTYTLEDKYGNSVYFVGNGYVTDSSVSGATNQIQVKNGATVTLEDLPAGTYTITEQQLDGYSIRAIDGEATTNYSKDYVVVNKSDEDIPVATFTNTRLTEKTAISVSKVATGLDSTDKDYPDPTISIYSTNADGDKTGTALWSGTLDANGDILYLSTYFAAGTYVVEETGADVNGYTCTTTISVGGQVQEGMFFTITEEDIGGRLELTIYNTYEERELTASKAPVTAGSVTLSDGSVLTAGTDYTEVTATTENGTTTYSAFADGDGKAAILYAVTLNGFEGAVFTVSDTGATYKGYSGNVSSVVTEDDTYTVTLSGDKADLYFTKDVTIASDESIATAKNTAIVNGGDIPSEDVTVTKAEEHVIIVKSVSVTRGTQEVTLTEDDMVQVGEVLTYTVTVENTGNTELDVTVEDNMMVGDITVTRNDEGTTVQNVNGVYTISNLDAGETVSITYTYTVTDADEGSTIENTATATTTDGGPNGSDTITVTVEADDEPVVPVVPDPPALNTEDHVAYIIGYPDGTVQPEGNITRAEVATIFFRLLRDEARETYWSQTNSYSDVSDGSWYNNAISTLSNMGIIDGYPDGTFRPNAYITRAELTKIAVSFFEYADENFTYNGQFTDVNGNEWYASFVAVAAEFGLVEGYPDGTFKPDSYITRAETCTVVNRTLGRAPHEDRLLSEDVMITWPDNPKGTWYYADMQEATNSHDYVWTYASGERVESWTVKLIERDWEALEKQWSDANSAPGGEVMEITSDYTD